MRRPAPCRRRQLHAPSASSAAAAGALAAASARATPSCSARSRDRRQPATVHAGLQSACGSRSTSTAAEQAVDRSPPRARLGRRPPARRRPGDGAGHSRRACRRPAPRHAPPALEQLRADAEALGGSVGYTSTTLRWSTSISRRIASMTLAALPGVSSLGLERTWATTMSSAGPAVQAELDKRQRGSGRRRRGWRSSSTTTSATPATWPGEWSPRHSTSGVAGLHRRRPGPPDLGRRRHRRPGHVPGVAPGARHRQLVDRRRPRLAGARIAPIIAAADWAASAAGGDADVVNASIGQDTATGSEEARRYFDAIGQRGRPPGRRRGRQLHDVRPLGHRLAGHRLQRADRRRRSTTAEPAGRSDDRIWYAPGSNGSNYRDRTGTAWNAHGDFNKPNVSAPAASVDHGERARRQRDERRQPDRGRHRGPGHRAPARRWRCGPRRRGR